MDIRALDAIDDEIVRHIVAMADPEETDTLVSHCNSIRDLYGSRAIVEQYVIRARTSIETI